MKLGKPEIDALVCPPGRRELVRFDDDLKGLGIRVTAKGAKVFLFEYWRAGRTWRIKIGEHGPVTVAGARRIAARLRGEVAGGGHPAQARDAERQREAALRAASKAQAAAATLTFAALLAQWERGSLKGRRPRYAGEVVRALTVNFAADPSRPDIPAASPAMLAALPVHEIDAAAARKALDAIGRDRGAVMAHRSHAYARAMFGWAKRRGLVAENPFAAVAKEGREVARERVLTDAELGEVWRATFVLGWPYGDFVRFLLLTAQREAEVAGLRRGELAGDLSVWNLPGARAKNGKAHIVHLSEPARAILRAASIVKKSSLVFTTTGTSQINSFGHAKKRLDRAIIAERTRIAGEQGGAPAPLEPWRLHDLRRTAVTVMAQLGVRWEVADKLLNHVQGRISGVGAIYQRHEFLAEREAALRIWAEHVLALGSGRTVADNVVELRRA